MRTDEATAVSRLAGLVLSGGTTRISELHAGIAGRAFAGVGPAARPVQVVHDTVSSLTYRTVGAALGAGASALGARASRLGDGRPLEDTPAARVALAILNGAHGDLLDRETPALATTMTVRQAGQAVPVEADAIAAAFPDPSGRLAVFLHGLTETETSWCYKSGRHHGRPGVTYGTLLEQDLGLTPVFLRYNTGLHVSDNGRRLAVLLDTLLEVWPVPVQDVVLIGHSMGGLVARSALHQAGSGTDEAHPWTRLVRDSITLGTPHLGAPLERGAHALTHTLARLPETRPLATLLAARSVGIKDLRYGACVDEDWCDCEDPDEFLNDRCTEVPFLPDAHYYFIGATLMDGPVGSALGDLLVRIPSASGRGNGKGRSIPFDVDNGHELTGLTHMDLLNHPAVYEQMRTWITRARTDGKRLPAVTA